MYLGQGEYPLVACSMKEAFVVVLHIREREHKRIIGASRKMYVFGPDGCLSTTSRSPSEICAGPFLISVHKL